MTLFMIVIMFASFGVGYLAGKDKLK